MAADWIKMREDLFEDPAVLWMAQRLGVRPETVVGYCHRFWGLVSRQTLDGCLPGVSLLSLGNVIALPGFPELLVEAGWLEYDDSDPDRPVVTIPKFERHLSESAKKRALTAEKKRLQRAERQDLSPLGEDKCPKNAGQKRGPEKRREEKSNKEKETKAKKAGSPNDIEWTSVDVSPEELVEFRALLDRWHAYRTERRQPLLPKSWQQLARTWADRGLPAFREAVETSIANGYQGLFEPRSNGRTEVQF
ncbi:MAG: hypothetical protein ACR2RE_31735 [Geminicoccaceae bacterium]